MKGVHWNSMNNYFLCFIGKFGKSRGLISVRMKGKKIFFVNKKVKQVLIWRLQNRHLILNQLIPDLDGGYLNIVEYLKIERFWKENYALEEKENNLI